MARTDWMGRSVRVAAALGAGFLPALAGAPARADVIDIAPDGQVTVIRGPSLYLTADPSRAQPIVAPAPTRRPERRPPARPQGPVPQGPLPRAHVINAINLAARTQNLDPGLIEAVAWQESRLRPNAVSPKGAMGVMQLMPATARALGVQGGDVAGNVNGGAAYLRLLLARYDGDLIKALAAYNAGPGAVDRHGGPPPYRETRLYVDAILERLADRAVPDNASPSMRPRP